MLKGQPILGFLTISLVLLGSRMSLGATQSLFPVDGSRAVILLNTSPSSKEVLALFHAMDKRSQSETETKKNLGLKDGSFDLSCNKVKDLEMGSCTISIRAGDRALIDPKVRSVVFKIDDETAKDYFEYFQHAKGTDEYLFLSGDRKLQVLARENFFLVTFQE